MAFLAAIPALLAAAGGSAATGLGATSLGAGLTGAAGTLGTASGLGGLGGIVPGVAGTGVGGLTGILPASASGGVPAANAAGMAAANGPDGLGMGQQFETAMAGGTTPAQAGTGTVGGTDWSKLLGMATGGGGSGQGGSDQANPLSMVMKLFGGGGPKVAPPAPIPGPTPAQPARQLPGLVGQGGQGQAGASPPQGGGAGGMNPTLQYLQTLRKGGFNLY